MPKYAVEVKNVKKSFFLPHHKNNSLKSAITQVFKSKDRGGKTFNALNGISFNVEKGDFFGILGRNGSGKSTLLKIISEIYQPTSGTVKHDGKLVSFIELGVGFKPELSGRENVFLNGALLGFSKEEIAEMYDDIVAFAELEPFMDQKLKNYSSGMRVRLAFSVAIQARADILVLDEVLAVGDADFQNKCNQYFKTLKDDGKTVILVTHSMGAVREYCNKAILIEGGKIIQEGQAEKVADGYLKLFNKVMANDNPAKGDRWGDGSVVINSFKVEIAPDKIELIFKLRAAKQPIENAVLGFRIRDSRGKLLAGANNLNSENAEKMNFTPKEEKTLRFTMPNIFGNDTYSIGATVRLSDGITTCDSWENMEKFTNLRSEVYYPILCPAKLVIEHGNSK